MSELSQTAVRRFGTLRRLNRNIMLTSLLVFAMGLAPAQNQPKSSLAYLKQPPPGLVPKVFAPGIVSKENEYEFGSVFSEDGKEFYYAVNIQGKAEIRYMRLQGEKWTEPQKLIYDDQYGYNDPFLSPDENKLYFISDRPLTGSGPKKDVDIWYVEKEGNGWSAPINASQNINSAKNEYYISFTQDGTMYFASNKETSGDNKRNFDIYASLMINGEFQKPGKLGNAINTPGYEADVFVAYDESYIIFCSERKEGYGQGDLYISFKNEEGTWTKAKNMGDAINTRYYEFCPFVTKDGKYLFYSSNQDIYWVNAEVIGQLR